MTQERKAVEAMFNHMFETQPKAMLGQVAPNSLVAFRLAGTYAHNPDQPVYAMGVVVGVTDKGVETAVPDLDLVDDMEHGPLDPLTECIVMSDKRMTHAEIEAAVQKHETAVRLLKQQMVDADKTTLSLLNTLRTHIVQGRPQDALRVVDGLIASYNV